MTTVSDPAWSITTELNALCCRHSAKEPTVICGRPMPFVSFRALGRWALFLKKQMEKRDFLLIGVSVFCALAVLLDLIITRTTQDKGLIGFFDLMWAISLYVALVGFFVAVYGVFLRKTPNFYWAVMLFLFALYAKFVFSFGYMFLMNPGIFAVLAVVFGAMIFLLKLLAAKKR